LKGKKQIKMVLERMKNGLERTTLPNPEWVPTPISLFLGLSLSILVAPDHYLYPHVNRFFLQRPFLDLQVLVSSPFSLILIYY